MRKFTRASSLVAVLVASVLSAMGAAPYAGAEAKPAATVQTQKEQAGYTIEVAGVRYSPVQPKAIWAACGMHDPVGKVVRTFPRNGAPGAGGNSNLLCGTEGFGYRHIKARHMQDWQNLAGVVGSDWRSFTDWAVEQILKAPEPGSPVYDKARDTWTYRAPVQIRDSNGKVVDTYRPIVAIANQDQKIITAYPAR